MATQMLPTYIYLLSRRDKTKPFNIRCKRPIAAFTRIEKARSYMEGQRDGWQNVELSTEYKIAVSGEIVDGFPEGLSYV